MFNFAATEIFLLTVWFRMCTIILVHGFSIWQTKLAHTWARVNVNMEPFMLELGHLWIQVFPREKCWLF